MRFCDRYPTPKNFFMAEAKRMFEVGNLKRYASLEVKGYRLGVSRQLIAVDVYRSGNGCSGQTCPITY